MKRLNRSFETRIQIAKLVLERLGNKTMCRTDWEMACNIGTNRFNYTLNFLLRNGYVQRPIRGVYKRTDKGEKFLEAITFE